MDSRKVLSVLSGVFGVDVKHNKGHWICSRDGGTAVRFTSKTRKLRRDLILAKLSVRGLNIERSAFLSAYAAV